MERDGTMRYTCLMYHHIEEPASMKFSVSPDRFKAQMEALKRLGVQSWLPGGDVKPSSAAPCFITFDDGHRSNLYAAEILRDMGLKGCFYVVKDFALNDAAYLDEAEIKAISDMGHMIGVHGKVHEWWTKFDDRTLSADLLETKSWIEDLTGKPVVTCAAVGGKIDARVIRCIRESIPDMPYIRTIRFGTNREGDTLLKTVAVTKYVHPGAFCKAITCDPLYYVLGSVGYGIKEMVKPVYHLIVDNL